MSSLSFIDRLGTFDGYWDDSQVAARQLAAVGHVSDRPPLESLEEGSRCVSCSHFTPKVVSVALLQGTLDPSIQPWMGPHSSSFHTNHVSRSNDSSHGFHQTFGLHHPGCERLQVRMPFDPLTWARDYSSSGGSVHTMSTQFEERHLRKQREQEGLLVDDTQRAHIRQEQFKKPTSSFFSLPTELRLEIYALVLPSLEAETEIVTLNRDSTRLVTRTAAAKPSRRDKPTQTSILRVCRATHAEALDLIYTRRTFKFSAGKLLYLFLRRIGYPGRRLLNSVDIHCGAREDALAFALLACCERLTEITIRLPRPRILFPRAPIWCLDGMACLLDVSGLSEVRFGTCATPDHLDDKKPDAAVVRRELTRAKGASGHLRTVNGILDV